ncbi:uncharacterized protein BDR25DRAFT_392297 [Lindgomyces ingoldianus]|uniref:Uncharacterized protein n=1 Tax=Lindgomyces ingoldianus TaxID=673940 RepID=A0ACB6R404_9PLEO|nr:uncharacterized protein BDR25DRAFT_392297 [Lindgomyces ingoldianus]KAF2473911.1 hypothetical protein BDR25DRAFT_392297 [Lindgomyces ingoldianus]
MRLSDDTRSREPNLKRLCLMFDASGVGNSPYKSTPRTSLLLNPFTQPVSIAMSTPSYTRPTASSVTRASPRAQKPAVMKELKRPSSISDSERELIQLLRRAEAFTIKPADPSKPCLADLPSEIRIIIYRYILDPYYPSISCAPKLLRVSRAIRHEAAYEWYSRAAFTFHTHALEFKGIKQSIERLPIAHRLFLTRNRNILLEIEIGAVLEELWSWDPRSMLDAWNECRQFGNPYEVKGSQHKDHFMSFCRLAGWFQWCGKPAHYGIRWQYKMDVSNRESELWWGSAWPSVGYRLEKFLKGSLGVFPLPCVQQATSLDAGQKAVMKKEALNMLESLDKDFKQGGVLEMVLGQVVSVGCLSWGMGLHKIATDT